MDVEKLRGRLDARRRIGESGLKRAAVLVAICVADAKPHLLLTRRTDTVPTHKGQVAFPGGGATDEDEGPHQTALREAEEEVGLDPLSVEILGCLDDFPTVNRDTWVTPVVAVLRQKPSLEPDPNEVARIFWVSLDDLVDKKRWRREEHLLGASRWPVFYFDADGENLWGLSAYIVLQLLALLPAGAPLALPAPYDQT
mgnify:CR=1 FL=1